MIKDTSGVVTNSEYIPSEGNKLPGGIYKDADGNKMKVYTTMACCKGSAGTDSICIGSGANPRKSVAVPIPVVVMPDKDILKPIYSDVLIDSPTNPSTNKQFTSFGVTVNGINTNIKPFYYDPDFKNKINSLTSNQLDSIIYQCANKTMCLKSNYVGLQIKTSTDPTIPGGICDSYNTNGQTSATNQNSETSARCHAVMRHVCSKKIYDQGCISMNVDENGTKYPSWVGNASCRVYNNMFDTNGSKTILCKDFL